MPVKAPPSRLARLIQRLRTFHGAPVEPPTRDPYHLLLWEQVAYLASDAERLAAFRLLEERVGFAPEKILGARQSVLEGVTRKGGAIGYRQRAERLRRVAERVLEKWKGDLRTALRPPLEAARKELAKYPSIGLPGAERILLLTGADPVLGLDSNALRVLQRLGYGRAGGTWSAQYRSAQEAASAELPATVASRRPAFLLLRHHGQTICRRTAPRCGECPLLLDCPTGAREAGLGSGALSRGSETPPKGPRRLATPRKVSS